MKKSNLFTVTAIDGHSSDTMSRTFSTENPENFKKAVQEFEAELPYRRYELTTAEFIEEYSQEIVDILDELEIVY
jgi:2,3-bisphosphoglycerate-independent phosphoglycerate mutase